MPEETFEAQQRLQVDVLDLFRMVDRAANGTLTGHLPKREIQVLLKGTFDSWHYFPPIFKLC